MTRFARAKGSKASNERQEEDPTPWNVMRKQLASQLNSNHPQASLNKDACIQLKHTFDIDRSSNKEEIWCDFDVSNRKERLTSNKNNLKEDTKNNKLHVSGNIFLNNKLNVSEHATNQLMSKLSKKESKNVNKLKFIESSNSDENELYNTLNEDDYNYENGELPKTVTNSNSCSNEMMIACDNKTNSLRILSKNKSKHSVQRKSVKHPEDQPMTNIPSFSKISFGHIPKQNIVTDISSNSTKEDMAKLYNKSTCIQSDNPKFKKNKKEMDNTPILNSNNNNNYLFANGKVIKLVKYEGFLIKKDDAVRLKNLRKKLKNNDIEKEKINAIMKLERRKAEKALAREKRNVCFHCRKFGHLLKDCPESKGSEMLKSGICFKCGSMEHTYYQCNVMKNEDFRHAICFICKEQGHIARQCSINPQGQYPKGGCCHLCGEVAHLRKDCPKAINEKPENALKLENTNKNYIIHVSSTPLQKNKLYENKKEIVKF